MTLLISATHLYLHKIITQPIQRISTVAEKISRGDFDTRVSIKSNDELGVLGNSIDSMAKN